MAGAVLNRITLGFVTFEEKQNADRPEGLLNVSVAMTGKASDVARVVKLAGKCCDVVTEMQGSEASPLVASASKTFGTVYAGLNVTRLPIVTRTAKEAVTSDQAIDGRGAFARLRDITDAIAAWQWSAVLFGAAHLVKAANIFSFISDGASLPLDAGDVKMAHDLIGDLDLSKVSPELRARFEDTRTLAFIKMVKTAASVITGAMTVLMYLAGVTLLSASAILGVGFVGAGAGLYASYFEKTRMQKPFDLDAIRAAESNKKATVV